MTFNMHDFTGIKLTENRHAGEEVNEQTPWRQFNLDLEEEGQIFFRDIDTNQEKEDQAEVSVSKIAS